MAIRIWSSFPIEILKRELSLAGISSSQYHLLDRRWDPNKAEILFGSIPLHQLTLHSRAKWIQLDSAGAEGMNGVHVPCVTHVAGVFSKVIAESLLGSILAIYRGLYDCADAQVNRKWRRWDIRSSLDTLSGREILVLGGGTIAKAFLKLIEPFQCEVTVFRRKADTMEHCRVITQSHDLDRALASCDIVISSLPGTPETRNFLNRDRLKRLGEHAIVVNVGRGATLDEDTLCEMLEEGRLRAAILDVTLKEPLDASSPLWKAPRLYLTQHTFGGHRDELVWKCRFFAQNFRRYLAGKPLANEMR